MKISPIIPPYVYLLRSDIRAKIKTTKVVENPLYEDVEIEKLQDDDDDEREFDIEDEHEPMYQPEDPGEIHDEL